MPIKINSSSGGSVSLDAPSSLVAANTITLPSTSGGTFLTTPLAAGTTTVPPLDFVSGTNMTTPDTGAMEYDGKSLYFTPIGTQRGIVPGMQFYCLQTGYTFNSSTSIVSLYNVGVTLSASTVYAFEGLFILVRSNSLNATSNMGFGGTATVNNIIYQTHTVFDSGGIPQVDTTTNISVINTTAMTAFTTGAAVGTITGFVTGTVSINAGGTFIPQYSQSAIGTGTLTNQAGCYFRIYPIGASGSNINVGTWA
jgi:hypothetical protein